MLKRTFELYLQPGGSELYKVDPDVQFKRCLGKSQKKQSIEAISLLQNGKSIYLKIGIQGMSAKSVSDTWILYIHQNKTHKSIAAPLDLYPLVKYSRAPVLTGTVCVNGLVPPIPVEIPRRACLSWIYLLGLLHPSSDFLAVSVMKSL
jgi:hypothetical protein